MTPGGSRSSTSTSQRRSQRSERRATGRRIALVYSQIASNKRRSVLFIGVFFLIWIAIGAIGGLLFIAFSHRVQYNANGTTTTRQLRRGARLRGHGDLRDPRALRRPVLAHRGGRARAARLGGRARRPRPLPADPRPRRVPGHRRGHPEARGLRDRRPLAQRLRDRGEPREGRDHLHDRAALDHEPRGARGRHGPRDEPHQEPRHPAAPGRRHDDRHGGAAREHPVAQRVLLVDGQEPRQRQHRAHPHRPRRRCSPSSGSSSARSSASPSRVAASRSPTRRGSSSPGTPQGSSARSRSSSRTTCRSRR